MLLMSLVYENFEIYNGSEILYFVPEEKRKYQKKTKADDAPKKNSTVKKSAKKKV